MAFGIRRLGLCVGLFLFSSALLSPPGLAQDSVPFLTEDNVRDFVQRTTDVTSRKDPSMTPEDVLQYLQDHLDPEGHFKSRLTYNVPGYPTQENDMSLDKDQFIQSVVDGEKSLSDYQSTITVKNIKLSSDSRKATVETSSHETGTMKLQGESGAEESIPVEGDSKCTQILKLSDEGFIRMFNANCSTEITFKQPF